MKQYAYVSVRYSGWSGRPKEDHRALIDEYARKGYRYVGFLPKRIGAYGSIAEIELIFEQDQDWV